MNDQTRNPLLHLDHLPAFSRIHPQHVVPAVEQSLTEARATIAALVDRETSGWDDLFLPLETLADRLEQVWSPVSHLHGVADNAELRAVYNVCLPMLSEYQTEVGQNQDLFRALQRIADSEEMGDLPPEKRKILENALLDFRLSGVALGAEEKSRFKVIAAKLSALEARFSENVLDATQAWKKSVAEFADLSGLPDTAITLARETAEREGHDGWMLTLEFPSYLSVITFADDRDLRREVYEAYSTRSSDQGPNAGKWDNTAVIEEILALRDEKARLVGFSNYAEYSLVRKMAPSVEQVLDFLRDLAKRTKPIAKQELHELGAFAREQGDIIELEAWDISYYAEKLRQHRFAFSQEELRAYFPLPKVLSGLFYVVGQLFGLQVQQLENREIWHPEVNFYEIRDQDGEVVGRFFLDLYARSHKRGGAWMAECMTRKAFHGDVQLPVAHLVCNFSPPLAGRPSLLTHEEVLTLFHEFGHALHHLLTKVDYPSIAGINGVSWDAVELPSQLLELWCWEQEALSHISGHVDTGRPLPNTLLEKMRAARNFQSGMAIVRQLEFALFDLRIHGEYNASQGARVQQFLDEVRREVAVVIPPAFNRFAHSFSHIFAGGYAAGYYSYKWAEVLASDAFSRFEEEGIFNRNTGLQLQQTVLEQGGAREAMALFVAFRGREPTIDALLRHNGIGMDGVGSVV